MFAVTGYRLRKRSVAPVTEVRRCANPTIRLCGTTTTISLAHCGPKAAIFRLAAAASFSTTRVVRASLAFEEVVRLAVRGPIVAVGESPSPQPYHALSYAPLATVASAYRAAGAEVFNIGDSDPVMVAVPEE